MSLKSAYTKSSTRYIKVPILVHEKWTKSLLSSIYPAGKKDSLTSEMYESESKMQAVEQKLQLMKKQENNYVPETC